MIKSSTTESLKLDRKTVEKNRRIHMKDLCFKLSSLIPSNQLSVSKEMLSQQDLMDHAAKYIKEVRERIQELKRKKELIEMRECNVTDRMTSNGGLRFPIVELREFGCSLGVILISGLKKNFMLHEVVNILMEEGAEVVSASYSTLGDKVFHSLHAQVKISRVGIDTSSICQRLKGLIHGIP